VGRTRRPRHPQRSEGRGRGGGCGEGRAAEFDAWLALFAATCTYHIVPPENYERGLPAGLVYCDSRAMLEDRIRALREANKYNIHTDRHLIGLPRLIGEEGEAKLVEAPFAVYQTDQ
jgi:3-phenylpropionate/cinnamic acid dioxygenase small subunit